MTNIDLSTVLNTSIGKISLGNILSAIVTLVICLLVIHLLMKLLRQLLGKSKLDSRVQKYLTSGIKLVLYVIAALIVVDSLGIPITSLVALLSVASLGITLAAEDILSNVAGGLVILSSHPFAIGDFVEASGTSGTVEEITLNHTKLITADGLLVMVPNKTLASSQMTNYTAIGRRRVKLTVTASYDASTEDVKAACQKAFHMTDRILPDPAPAVHLSNYGESSIEYTLFCWTKAETYWDVYYDLTEHLRETFAQAGVEMTYDHLNIHIVEQN
jgi:small conductance mechanosensitive channel